MGRPPRLPLTIFERTGVADHQSLARDHLAYCNLATDRQQSAHDIVREHHALTISRVERRNPALSDALRANLKFAIGCWVWVYNTAVTIRLGAKTDTDAKVLKAKRSLNWTDIYEVLGVGPCIPADTPDGLPWALGSCILIYPPTCPVRMLAGAFRCNPARPVPTPTHDHGAMPKYLSAGLTRYVLNNFSRKSPLYHLSLIHI